MAPEKNVEKQLELLRLHLQEGKVIIGADRVLKALRQGSLQEIFLAHNCPEKVKKDVQRYAALKGTAITDLPQTNEELGVFCKKNFFVSVLGITGE